MTTRVLERLLLLAPLAAVSVGPGCVHPLRHQRTTAHVAPCPPEPPLAAVASAAAAVSALSATVFEIAESDSDEWDEEPRDGDYGYHRHTRFALTVEGSRLLRGLDGDDERLWGLGLYMIPSEAPVGFYFNGRFTLNSTGDPDLTDTFPYDPFGHDVVDEDLEAYAFNLGALVPLNESVNLFLGAGIASTAIETEFRDPSGTFLSGDSYFQRREEDTEFNVNLGALITVHPVAVTVQWDTALELFTFGAGFTF